MLRDAVRATPECCITWVSITWVSITWVSITWVRITRVSSKWKKVQKHTRGQKPASRLHQQHTTHRHILTDLTDLLSKAELHLAIALDVCPCSVHDTNNQQSRHDLHAGCNNMINASQYASSHHDPLAFTNYLGIFQSVSDRESFSAMPKTSTVSDRQSIPAM